MVNTVIQQTSPNNHIGDQKPGWNTGCEEPEEQLEEVKEEIKEEKEIKMRSQAGMQDVSPRSSLRS